MDWKVLIIGLIPLAVFILSTIFRSVEEAQEARRPPRVPEEGGPRKVRRPTSELDRFLEEARKRREKQPVAENETHVEIVLTPPPPPPPAEKPAEKPRPRVEERPRKPREAPPRRKVEAPRVKIPEALPVEPTPSGTVSPPLAAPAIVAPHSPPSVSLLRVMNLLRERDSLTTALVLHEIFDRPVSQRRRGRSG